MILYFCTVSNKFGEEMILEPRIPDSLDYESEEDCETKRICVSPSIVGCLSGISHYIYQYSFVYIYKCYVNFKDIIQPTIEQVKDCDITGELWITKPTKFKKYKTLKITKVNEFNNGINTKESFEYEYVK